MVRTAAQQRDYRARRREQMGNDEYKAAQAKERRERRDKNKIKVPQYAEITKEAIEKITDNLKQIVIDMASKGDSITLTKKKEKLEAKLIDVKKILDCGDLKKRLIETGVSETTALSYLKKTGRVYELMHNNKKWNCRNVDWLKDYEKVIDFVNNGEVPSWKTASTRSTHMNHISALVMRIPELKDVAKFYDVEKAKKNKEMGEARLDQELKPGWEKIIRPWRDVLAINKTAKFKSTFDEAVYGIFTLLPPRRSGSYFDLQIQPVGFKSEDANFITVDKKNNPKELVLNRYKTSKHYHEYRVDLPVALSAKIKKHIAGRKFGELVFNNRTTGKPYTDQRGFNQATTNVFGKYISKMGTTLLRISYASYIIFGVRATLKVQSEHARYLGHSLPMFQTYARENVEK